MNEDWEKRFDLLWGIAPPDSLKGKKGADVKSFISNLLSTQRQEVIRRILEAQLGNGEFESFYLKDLLADLRENKI